MGCLYFFISFTARQTSCLTNVKAPTLRGGQDPSKIVCCPCVQALMDFSKDYFSGTATDRQVAEGLS